MRICFLTEGTSEYRSLPLLFPQLATRSGNTFLRTLKIDVAPDVEPNVIARECHSRLKIAAGLRADLAVIVLDRERQSACPGLIATSIATAVGTRCGLLPIKVVLKDRKFENWLISDLDALRALSGRFKLTAAIEKKVAPNKADGADAEALLKQAAVGDYLKVPDAHRILARMAVERAAANSRSFRHLLHVVGDADYATQCAVPS